MAARRRCENLEAAAVLCPPLPLLDDALLGAAGLLANAVFGPRR
jgi:hypothetical protein